MNRAVWDLQVVENSVAGIHRERARLDDGTHARADLATVQTAFEAERGALNTLNARRIAQEDELKAAETKITRQNARLMTAQSAHEVTALQRDITALQKVRGDLDETILTLMEEAETSTSKLQGLEAQFTTAQKHAQDVEATFKREALRLKTALEAAVVEREAARAQLAPPELQKYESAATKHGGIAVVTVENGACSECGTSLTPFALREAKTREWPTCEGCGRLLWAE